MSHFLSLTTDISFRFFKKSKKFHTYPDAPYEERSNSRFDTCLSWAPANQATIREIANKNTHAEEKRDLALIFVNKKNSSGIKK